MVATPGAANNLSMTASADQYLSDARRLRARARCYRRLADLLCDEKIIEIVLACASEFDERADTLARKNTHADPPGCAEMT